VLALLVYHTKIINLFIYSLFKIISVVQNITSRMVGGLMNGELEIMQKEVVVA
jgi:hypothetical protein